MRTEHHKWMSLMSRHLSREMELKVYGEYGKPMLAFPSSDGRFYDYENFGMIGACEPFIDSGKVKIWRKMIVYFWRSSRCSGQRSAVGGRRSANNSRQLIADR